MRTLVGLCLLIPTLALAAPTEREWKEHEGERVEVAFIDGTRVVGTVVSVDGDQARVRTDDGAVTMVPLGVVATVEPAGSAPAPEAEEGPPPPDTYGAPPKRGPTVGVGLGVGMGPVSVGVGSATGPRGTAPTPAGGYKGKIVGVRFPLRGQETVDFLLFDADGASRPVPDELNRPRAMREYDFVDEWGRSVPWQAAWVGMGAEREYVDEVKRIDRTLLPLRATETTLAVGGIGLIVYSFIQSAQTGSVAVGDPYGVAGAALVLGNIGFSLGVTNPTRNRMRTQLGQKTLDRTREYYGK